jgi:large repetitive protein
VTFSALGSALATVTLNAGAANLPVSTAGIPVGNYVVSAAYSGDSANAASSAENINVAVLPALVASTATTLSASPESTTVGESVTLASKVTETNGTGTPTGTVTFLYGNQALATTSLSKGTATFTASTVSLDAGSYTLTARYNGDKVDTGSISPALTVTLGKASTTTNVTATPNPASSGASVTLTATVARSAGTGTPKGTVTFTADGKTLGDAPLTNGIAAIAASSTGVPLGTYVVTATYSGDAGDAASSGTVSETIQ